MVTYISRSPEATAELGESWGREMEAGWVVALSGELGAGKTQLVKGLARGLGIAARVHSPTFALLNLYAGGRLALAHLDLYRLENPLAVVHAGLEDYILGWSGVTVMEWAERWFDGTTPERPPQGPVRLRKVRMACLAGDERRIEYEDVGS